MADLHKELSSLRETHALYKAKLRDMELDNDALEKAERMIQSSLGDMESRYNKVMERTALLETELEAQGQLAMENQRLKDELREVREELYAVQRHANKTEELEAPVDAHPAPSPSGEDDLTLADLVVHRRAAPAPPTLERLREHMQQLQHRLQRAQALPTSGAPQRRWQRSSLPRPRSSLSASSSAVPPSPAWRAPTPSYAATPQRPETPGDMRKSKSAIPVPVGGLSRSASRSARPVSRLASEVQSPVGPTPFEFMEFDPAASPVAATRQATLARRRSLGPSALPVRPRPSSALRTSPTKPRVVSPGASPTKRTVPVRPWR